MELTMRKIFCLVIGIGGIMCIVLAHFVGFYPSSENVFLVTTNFHNSSVSYFAPINVSINLLSKQSKIKQELDSLNKSRFLQFLNNGRNAYEKNKNSVFNLTDLDKASYYQIEHLSNTKDNGLAVDTIEPLSIENTIKIEDESVSVENVGEHNKDNEDRKDKIEDTDLTLKLNKGIANTEKYKRVKDMTSANIKDIETSRELVRDMKSNDITMEIDRKKKLKAELKETRLNYNTLQKEVDKKLSGANKDNRKQEPLAETKMSGINANIERKEVLNDRSDGLAKLDNANGNNDLRFKSENLEPAETSSKVDWTTMSYYADSTTEEIDTFRNDVNIDAHDVNIAHDVNTANDVNIQNGENSVKDVNQRNDDFVVQNVKVESQDISFGESPLRQTNLEVDATSNDTNKNIKTSNNRLSDGVEMINQRGKGVEAQTSEQNVPQKEQSVSNFRNMQNVNNEILEKRNPFENSSNENRRMAMFDVKHITRNEQDIPEVSPELKVKNLENAVDSVRSKNFENTGEIIRLNGEMTKDDAGDVVRPIGDMVEDNIVHITNKTSDYSMGFQKDPDCVNRHAMVEDILCLKRPQFLPNYRNPCWNEGGIIRCLPYFYIIGVCKTGSTDLFNRLTHHPQVIKNSGLIGKETWFWGWNRYGHSNFYKSYHETMYLDDFINKFDSYYIESMTKRQPNGTIYHPIVTGHGDPMDFWDHSSWRLIAQNDPNMDEPNITTPTLVKHVNPGVKLILLLRDPVERLFSNYLHGKFGETADQFHEDVLASLSLLSNCRLTRTLKSCLYDSQIIRDLRVPISGSFYSVHLEEWFKVFPRKQFFIIRTEQFSDSVADTLLRVFRYLKLDPMPTRDLYKVANMPHFYDTKAKQTSGEIKTETREILQTLFEPYNTKLAKMLNDESFNFNAS